MKKLITAIALIFVSNAVFSQQDPQFSQFMHNKLFMNPAYAGINHALCFTAIGREQWAGFDGAPRSGIFSADLFTPNLGGGIGLNVMYDKQGFENNLSYNFNYSFHVNVSHGILGIGAEAGMFRKIIGPTGNDQWMATTNWTSDPSIPVQLKKTVGDFGLGIWYERKDVWFGISSSHLNSKTINDGQDIYNHNMIFQMARHYYITGGVNIALRNSTDWKIKPSFIIKTDATITAVDLNLTAMFRERFWFGASYRYKDAICPMVGFQWTNDNEPVYNTDSNEKHPVIQPNEQWKNGTFKVGFAYDYTVSNLKNYNNGTFELFLNYCIPWSGHAVSSTKVWDVRQGNW